MYLKYTKLNYVHSTYHWQATLYEEILRFFFQMLNKKTFFSILTFIESFAKAQWEKVMVLHIFYINEHESWYQRENILNPMIIIPH